MGVSLGRSGVGKTFGARELTQWKYFCHIYDPLFEHLKTPQAAVLSRCDTILYRPPISVTSSALNRQVLWLVNRFEEALFKLSTRPDVEPLGDSEVKLIIIDEANRLKIPAMEQVRDLHELLGIPIVLMGLPGFEKYVARFPQLSNSIGFYHDFKPLSTDELMDILETEKFEDLGFGFTNHAFTDRDAIASLVRIAAGNLRTLRLLCLQIRRILEINGLEIINDEVLHAARQAILGPSR